MDEQGASIKRKRKVYGMWKEGQATWDEYKNVVRACREATRKTALYFCYTLQDLKTGTVDFFIAFT